MDDIAYTRNGTGIRHPTDERRLLSHDVSIALFTPPMRPMMATLTACSSRGRLHGGTMHDEPGNNEPGHDGAVRSAAAFLLDAARGDVSTRTVVHVLRHWVSEGMTQTQLLDAVEVSRRTAEAKYMAALTAFENAIRGGLQLEQ
jgi:hypothetical protein